jgi:hypothetical protein
MASTMTDTTSLGALAAARALPLSLLADLELRPLVGGGLAIPYWAQDGQPLFERWRDVPGKPRFVQPKDVALVPYGLWRLQHAQRVAHLYIAEGESDAWALWAAGLPALGLPGAGTAGCLEAEHLEGVERIYVCPDADEAGEQMLRGVAARLAKLGWQGQAWHLRMPPGVKDVSDLRLRAPERFADELIDALERAEPLGGAKPAVPPARTPASAQAPAPDPATPAPAFAAPIPASLLRRQDPERKWLWHGYIARGAVTLFSSLWKAGKSTLLAHLLKAMGSPGLFCDLRVQACRVLYITEEAESRWAERRDALQFGDWCHFQIRPFRRKKASWPEWKALLAHVQALHEATPYDLVVLDTLSNLWPLTDENEAPQVQAALQPLHALGDDVALLAVHHLRKGDGNEATGSRGSGALTAFVDTILELRRFNPGDRKDCRRVLTGYGRDDETFDELVTELTSAGYVARGDKVQVRQQVLSDTIVGLLPPAEPGITYAELVEAWPGETVPSKQTLLDVLRSGTEHGQWQRTGTGKKGSPFTYWRPRVEATIFDPFKD